MKEGFGFLGLAYGSWFNVGFKEFGFLLLKNSLKGVLKEGRKIPAFCFSLSIDAWGVLHVGFLIFYLFFIFAEKLRQREENPSKENQEKIEGRMVFSSFS